jgi:predicted CxxxxCH...CXXCH cytochrome family protein
MFYMKTMCTILAGILSILMQFSGFSYAGSLAVDDCGYPVVQVPAGCTGCHGAPPVSGKHPFNTRCYRCHGTVIDSSFTFLQTNLHNNGTVDYAVGCSSCHGWNQGASPPQNLKGECGPGLDGVGAHKAMRMGTTLVHQAACSNCHVVPLSTWAEGHIDGDGKAEVVFSGLAKAGGAQPVWNGTTCKNVYCHGATLKGGDYKEPAWKDTSGAASRCGACHSLADPDNNTAADCSSCHPGTVAPDRSILPLGDHLNGVIDTAGAQK